MAIAVDFVISVSHLMQHCRAKFTFVTNGAPASASVLEGNHPGWQSTAAGFLGYV